MSVKPCDRRDRAFNNQATGRSRFVLGGKGVL